MNKYATKPRSIGRQRGRRTLHDDYQHEKLERSNISSDLASDAFEKVRVSMHHAVMATSVQVSADDAMFKSCGAQRGIFFSHGHDETGAAWLNKRSQKDSWEAAGTCVRNKDLTLNQKCLDAKGTFKSA